MPIAEFRLPDGRIAQFKVPDGTTPEQAQQMIAPLLSSLPQPKPEPGILSQLAGLPKEVGKGFIRGLTVDPVSGLTSLGYTGARAAGAELAPFEKTEFGQALGRAQTALAPSDAGMITQFGGGLGSLLSFIPGGVLKGGLGLATRLTQAGAVGSEEARSRAEQAALEGKAVSPGQQLQAQLMGTGVGFTELAPVERLAGPLKAVLRGIPASEADKIAPGLFNSAKRMLATGGIEGLQEGMANIAQDLIQKGVYDPNLDIGKSALGDAAMGASVGAFAQGAIEFMTRGKRGQMYQQLKTEERQKEFNDKMAAMEAANQKQIADTQQKLGVPDPTILALPAPAPKIEAVPERDPLMNPVGFFNANEINPDDLNVINKARKGEGKRTLSQFSIEDLADSGAPQAEIDRLLAYKTGYDGSVKLGAENVLNAAAERNVDTTTVGFRDFLRRSTGSEDLSTMSQPQLHSAFTALSALEPSQEVQVLPPGTNAIRFSDDQYSKSLDKLNTTFPEDNVMPRDRAIDLIKKSSGLKTDRDAESLLQSAIRSGDLNTVSRTVFELGIPGDPTSPAARVYTNRESAERSARKLGLEVREAVHQDIAPPSEFKALPGGPDIRQGTFKQGMEPAGYEIRSPDGKTWLMPTQDEADAKVDRLQTLRTQMANGFLGEAAKIEKRIADNQRKLDKMEAEGRDNTLEYKKLSADTAAQNKQLSNRIDQLKAKAKVFSAPLEIAPKGEKPVTREGFTLFEQGQPVAIFPTQQAAEEAALIRLPDDTLQTIVNLAPSQKGLMPKRLGKMAEAELQRRRGEQPAGFGVAFKGDRAEAEARLAEAGVFTPEFQKAADELTKKLRPMMERLGLGDLRLNILRSIKTGDGQTADGYYTQRLIAIALDAPNPMRTLRHEGIHALKELGAFTPQQWKVLEDRARSEWMGKYDIANRYKDMGLSQNELLEEAISDAFSDFDQTKAPPGLIGALFNKIRRFFEAFGNGLRGMGFQTAESVFETAEAGGLQPISQAEVTGAPKYALAQKTALSNVLSKVSNDLDLTENELAATSLGMQTGKGGTKAFREQKVGGIKNIIEFLENRYRESGLPPLNINSEDDRKTLSKLLSAEALAAIRSGGANIEWYNQVIDRMLGMASLKYPELRSDPNAQAAFRIAIAVSSQGMNVEDNLRFGERVYEQFSRNRQEGNPRFPEVGTGESLAAMKNNFRIANVMIDKMGMDDFRKFLETPFTANELNAIGLKVDELADEQVLGSAIFGPKIGFGFYSNLAGNFDPVTMDMWFMRTIGRLTGKLRGFDPAKYQSQVNRFRGLFDIRGDDGIYANQFSEQELQNALADEQEMIDLARKVKSLHEKDFKNNRSLFDSGQRVKTNFVKSAENIIKSLDAPKDAPANGTERRLLRDVVRRMRERVARVTGQDIPPASLQAIIWYPEQELYKALGAKLRVTSQNYADSMRKLLREEGFDERRISTAAQSGSRRARRADARDVAAGIGEADRRAGRALSPEAKESFLEKERERVFFEKEIEQPKAKTIVFEVAPSPADVQATDRWNQLSSEQKMKISKDVIDSILPMAMEAVGIKGYVANQIGSYGNNTNPSFGLFVKQGTADQIVELAKMLGYALSQQSMVVASPREAKGLDRNGAVRIPVGDISIDEANQIYQQLRAIRLNGNPIIDGQTTVHGNMVVMNFSGLPIEEFAERIHEQLQGDYNVTIDDVYSSLIEEKDYNYGNPQSDPRGNRGVLRERSRAFRAETSNLLEQKISQAEQGKYSLRSDKPPGRSGIGSGISIREQQPDAQSFDGVHYGKRRVDTLAGSMYGTGIKGAEARRVFSSPDSRIKNRVYFYIPLENGRMLMPESGLGNEVHIQRLNNILGPGEKFQSLVNATRTPDGQVDANALESAVIDAGYDGYAVPRMGMMVVLNADVPVIPRGTRQEVEATPDEDKVQIGDRKYALRQTDTPEFKQWFGNSKIVSKGYTGMLSGEDVMNSMGIPESEHAAYWGGLSQEERDKLIRDFRSRGKGKPQVMYHGTARDITEFRPKQANAIFVTEDPDFAEGFSGMGEDYIMKELFNNATPEQRNKLIMDSATRAMKNGNITKFEFDEIKRDFSQIDVTFGFIPFYIEQEVKESLAAQMPSRANIMPVFVRAENPFDYANPDHIEILAKQNKGLNDFMRDEISRGSWQTIEAGAIQKSIRAAGFDGFYVLEGGRKNLAVYEPSQIKSAIGNIGTFARDNNDIRYALALQGLKPDSALVPNEGGNKEGNLGISPERLGGKPIRMLIGTHNDIDDKGYGANHILNRVLNDPKRIPGGAEDLLEKIVRTAQRTAQNYTSIYRDGGKFILYDGKNSLVVSPEKRDMSIITMFVQENPQRRYGAPVWVGRAPRMAEFLEPVRGVEVFEREGRVSRKEVPVQTKRVYTPEEIARIEEAPVETPRKAGTLSIKRDAFRASLRDSMGQDMVDAIERTTTKREEKGFTQRMGEAISPTGFAKFRQAMINKYEAIERLSKDVAEQFGSKELLADTSAISAALFSDRAAGVAASSYLNGIPIYRKGFTSVSDMDGSVKGLIPILEPLAKYNDPFVFQAFQYYAATRRGKRLDAEGREKLFTPQDIKRGELLGKQYPEFKQVFDEYQKYNKGLVEFMRDTGVISEKEAEIWTQNWDYIPFYRQLEGEETAAPNVFSPIAGVSKPKKLKGGEAPLADFMETVVRNSRAAIEAGMKNVAAQRVMRDMLRLNQGELVPAALARGSDIVTVKENGLTKHYRVDDPLLVEALKSLNMPQLPFLEVLAMPSNILRNLVTKDPGFMLANLMRDSLQAWVTTGTNIIPIVDTFKQYVAALAGKSKEAQALAKAGLFAGYDFASDVKSSAREVESELRKRAGQRTAGEIAMLPLSKIWDMLDKGSSVSDVATRAEVYKRTLEETGNEAEALYQAMEVLNFSRKGNSALIRVLTALVPFMNARIQGLDVLYRSGFGKSATQNKERMQKAFITRSLSILALSAMYWMLASDTEEYETAEQEVRDNYWIIGNVRIPIPFEIGTVFKVFPERILEYFFGEDTSKDLKDSIVRNITSTLAFNPIPQAFLPAVENIANYSFFTGQPIVGKGLEDVAAKYQASAGTSLLAQEVGGATGYSPVKIDNLIRGYTGTLGTYAVMLLDSIMRGEGDPTKATMRAEQLPVIKRFFASPDSTGTVTAYYEMKKAVDESTRTINFLERTGNMEDLQEYMQDKGAKLQGIKPYIQALDKDMTMLREMRRAVQISSMEPDQKRDVLDNIRKAEVALTSRIQYVKKSID